MKITLDGKVALVTGAGAGIGQAIATAFAEIGAQVAVAEVDAAKCAALRRDHPDWLVEQVDVRRAEEVAALREAIDGRFGRLDVLVNNVGHHLNIFGPLEGSQEDDWQALYDINLRHMFIVCRAMIPLIRRGGAGGSIINLSSIEGFRGYPYNVLYGTFKSAVTGFTRCLAQELAPDLIRVNLIGPETTDSEQVPLDRVLRPELRAEADRSIPLGRFGRPEDHAGAAVFLATDMSAWFTGSCMLVDGGGFNGNVFQRTPAGEWTNMPIVTGKASY